MNTEKEYKNIEHKSPRTPTKASRGFVFAGYGREGIFSGALAKDNFALLHPFFVLE